MANHRDHRRRILEEIAGGNLRSQRSLARKLGIALGLVNGLIGSLAREKLIRLTTPRGRPLRYILTAKGSDEQLRLRREHLATVAEDYGRARAGIHRRLADLSTRCSSTRLGASAPRVVFFGAGDLAEMALMCVPTVNLELVGVVDDGAGTVFGGEPVPCVNQLTRGSFNGEPFDILVIVSTRPTEELEQRLKEMRFPKSRTVWL